MSEREEPSLETLQRAASAFGVPLADLIELPANGIHESVARYGADGQASIYMQRLKRRWHHKGAPQAEMRLAIFVLFGDDTDAIIAWLEEGK